MKKIFCVIGTLCACVCCLLFCACSEINYGVYIYSNGAIDIVCDVTLDKNTLSAASIDADDLMQKIDNIVENYKTNLLEGKDTTGVNFVVTKEECRRIVKISFDDINAYNRIYEIDTSTPEEKTIINGVFTTKYVLYEGKGPFASLETTSIYNQLFNYVKDTYLGGDEAATKALFADITVITSRVYPCSYHTGANADFHQVSSGYDIYIWQSNLQTELSDSPKNMQIWRTYLTQTNRIAWYGTAFLITIVAGLVLFVVLYNKRKQNNAQTPPQSTDNNTPDVPTVFVQNKLNDDNRQPPQN
ncbi:MAG: hypothetical protein IJU58_01465 [Clostridia bacterium]|nr:hypothetical protein [Clostridia bacterium]